MLNYLDNSSRRHLVSHLCCQFGSRTDKTDLNSGFPSARYCNIPAEMEILEDCHAGVGPSHIHEQATCIRHRLTERSASSELQQHHIPHHGEVWCAHTDHETTTRQPPDNDLTMQHATPFRVTQHQGAEDQLFRFAFCLDVWPKKVVLRCLPHAACCMTKYTTRSNLPSRPDHGSRSPSFSTLIPHSSLLNPHHFRLSSCPSAPSSSWPALQLPRPYLPKQLDHPSSP
jgi:hypothetical protein